MLSPYIQIIFQVAVVVVFAALFFGLIWYWTQGEYQNHKLAATILVVITALAFWLIALPFILEAVY